MTVILCKMDAAGNYFVRKMAMHYWPANVWVAFSKPTSWIVPVEYAITKGINKKTRAALN